MTVESNIGAVHGLGKHVLPPRLASWEVRLASREVSSHVSQNAAIFFARNLLSVGSYHEITPDLSAKTTRVEVDPNQFTGPDSAATVVRRSRFARTPFVGEFVVAVQTDEDDGDFVGSAIVTEIDEDFDLVYLVVDWDGFRHEDSQTHAHAAEPILQNYAAVAPWKTWHANVKWQNPTAGETRHDSNPAKGRFRELSKQ